MRWEEHSCLQDERHALEDTQALFASQLLVVTDTQYSHVMTFHKLQTSISQPRGIQSQIDHLTGVSHLFQKRIEKAQRI